MDVRLCWTAASPIVGTLALIYAVWRDWPNIKERLPILNKVPPFGKRIGRAIASFVLIIFSFKAFAVTSLLILAWFTVVFLWNLILYHTFEAEQTFINVLALNFLFVFFLLLVLTGRFQVKPLPPDQRLSFQYDFRFTPNAWRTLCDKEPTVIARGMGVKLACIVGYDELLEKMFLLEDEELLRFTDGVIECEVYLEPGATFNVMLRGIVQGNRFNDEYYLARLDARQVTPEVGNGILFKPSGSYDWRYPNKPTTNSFPSKWLRMRIKADGQRISLYCDGQQVDRIENTRTTGGRIAMFAESNDVYVRLVRIYPG